MSSTSSTDEVPGFTISRTLGAGPHGTVHEATQDGLGRCVALKIGSWPPADWPEHAGVARLFAAGRLPDGRVYTAAQLAPGGSLRHPARTLTRARALGLCDEVEATLAALGVPHGALHAGNVLIDAQGHALLRDFAPGGRVEDDAAALDRLRASCARLPRRDRRPLILAATATLTAAAVALLAAGGDDDAEVRSIGCDGRPASGASLACTIIATNLRLPHDARVGSWTVRGARGDLQLQLVHPLGDGYYIEVGASGIAHVTGDQTFTTNLAGRRGDLVALAVSPGAVFGTTGAGRTLRFTGRLGQLPPRRSSPGPRRTLALSVMSRPVRTIAPVPAPRPGPTKLIATAPLAYAKRHSLRVVTGHTQVILELRHDAATVARLTVRDADPRGSLTYLSGDTTPQLGWRNPDGNEIARAWTRSPTAPQEVY